MFRPLKSLAGFVSDATRTTQVMPADRLPVENVRLLNSVDTSCSKRGGIRIFQKVYPRNKNHAMVEDPDRGDLYSLNVTV
jgi:hypothetical protein